MSANGNFAAAIAVALWAATNTTAAQDDGRVKVEAGKPGVAVDVNSRRDRDGNANRRDRVAGGMAHRASEIQGMTVKNDSGKKLGTVKDIVIDVRGGEVKYAALSRGGFLGLGDKLFAVPWNAFEQRHDARSETHTLILGVDEATLEEAPGFGGSEWPNLPTRA